MRIIIIATREKLLFFVFLIGVHTHTHNTNTVKMKRKRKARWVVGWVQKVKKVWRRESKRIRTKEEQIIPPLLLLLIIRIKLTKGGSWESGTIITERQRRRIIKRF